MNSLNVANAGSRFRYALIATALLVFCLVVLVVMSRQPQSSAYVTAPSPPDFGQKTVLTREQEQQIKHELIDHEPIAGEHTFAKTPINKLDDYEYSRIFQSERLNRNELPQTTVNSLLSQHQFDWANLPFNSEGRAIAEEAFIGAREEEIQKPVLTEPFFGSVSGGEMQPLDLAAAEEREKAILAQYRPSAADMVKGDQSLSVQELIHKVYANDPDWEPVIEKTGDNQYAVKELRPKPKQVKFQDEIVPTIGQAIESGLTALKGHGADKNHADVSFVQTGPTDPYFDKNGVLDYSGDAFYKYDQFNKWTPGLERMFAPTVDTRDWVGTPEK